MEQTCANGLLGVNLLKDSCGGGCYGIDFDAGKIGATTYEATTPSGTHVFGRADVATRRELPVDRHDATPSRLSR